LTVQREALARRLGLCDSAKIGGFTNSAHFVAKSGPTARGDPYPTPPPSLGPPKPGGCHGTIDPTSQPSMRSRATTIGFQPARPPCRSSNGRLSQHTAKSPMPHSCKGNSETRSGILLDRLVPLDASSIPLGAQVVTPLGEKLLAEASGPFLHNLRGTRQPPLRHGKANSAIFRQPISPVQSPAPSLANPMPRRAPSFRCHESRRHVLIAS